MRPKHSSFVLIATLTLWLVNCSESRSAEQKAIKFCERDQFQTFNLASMSASEKPEEHIASDDLAYLRKKNENRGKGLFGGLSAGIDKVAPWMAQAMSKHIKCSVISTKKADNGVWEIELKQEVPDFKHENPLAAMGSLMGAPDQETLQTIVDGWVKKSGGAIKTKTHTMRVTKQGEHLVLIYEFEKQAEEEKKKAEAKAKRDKEAARRTRLEEELARAKEVLGKAKKADEILSKLNVKSATFEQIPQRFTSRTQPLITLTVKNELGESISRAYFEGTLKSFGRSVPWIKETFNYSISGGLEPGEEVTWKLEPNMFSEWGKVDAPKDAKLTLRVVELDGVDKKKIASLPTESKGLDYVYPSFPELEARVFALEAKLQELDTKP